jgi:N-acetylglutamate synthase-like GNAT family acetyltransferase
MIRPYRFRDLEIIVDIGNRAWQGIYAMFKRIYGEELFKLLCSDEFTKKGKEIKSHCEKNHEWTFICEEEDKIVGFTTFNLDKETKIGEIRNNAVDPDCKMKGIGQQMYKAVLDYFRQQGMLYAKVITGLDEAHARARKAYDRAGFNIKCESVEYFMKL